MPYWQNWEKSFLWMSKNASVKVRKQEKNGFDQKENIFCAECFCGHLDCYFVEVVGKLPQNFHTRFAPGPNLRKKSTTFQKQCFFKNRAPPDNWIAVLNILPKRFYQFCGINFCINPKKTWFLWNEFSCSENFPLETLEVFLKSPAGNFSLAVRKKFCNWIFFQNKCFCSKQSSSTKCENLVTLLKLHAKSQKQFAQNP